MHLQPTRAVLNLLLFLLPSLTLTLTLTLPTTLFPLTPLTPLAPRQSPPSLTTTINTVLSSVSPFNSCPGPSTTIESKFTTTLVSHLLSQYPTKNVAVYADLASVNSFVGAVGITYKLTCGLGWSQTYAVYVFDEGDLWHKGDGGYPNWCFGGNYVRVGTAGVRFGRVGAGRKRGMGVVYGFEPRMGANESHVVLQSPVRYAAPVIGEDVVLDVMSDPVSANVTARAGGSYLVHCGSANGTVVSGLAYYKSFNPRAEGQQPDDLVFLARHEGVNISVKTAVSEAWRFPVGAVEFGNVGAKFHWNLFGNAFGEHVGVDRMAGFADNGTDHLVVYKGDGSKVFVKDGWTCLNLFYAF